MDVDRRKTGKLTRIVDLRASYYEAELLKELKIPKEATIADFSTPLFPNYVHKSRLPQTSKPQPIRPSRDKPGKTNNAKSFSTPRNRKVLKSERDAEIRQQQILERQIRELEAQLARMRPRHLRGASLPGE